jgi:5-methylcytosine-specific restriction endonuclease McrA
MRSRRRDPVTPEVYAAVRQRDGGCVGPRVGLVGRCGGPIEVDHVRASGGLGMRSRSTLDNLVSLCQTHHRYKTEHGREVRPILLAYIERTE